MNKKVCIYCRTATESECAIDLQIETLKNFAKKNNFENLEVFVDNGVSGLNFDRKGFKKLLKLIEKDMVSTLIVKDVSRLGRNYIEIGKLIEYIFPKHNVRFIAVNDGIDSDKFEDDFAPFSDIINKCQEKLKVLNQKNKSFVK